MTLPLTGAGKVAAASDPPLPTQFNYAPSSDMSGWSVGDVTIQGDNATVLETATTATHNIFKFPTTRTAAAKTFVFQADIDASLGRAIIALVAFNGIFDATTGFATAIFDTGAPSAGAPAVTGTAWTGGASSILRLSNGRYRCKLEWTTGAADTGLTPQIQFYKDAVTSNYLGDITKGFKIYNAYIYNKNAGAGGT